MTNQNKTIFAGLIMMAAILSVSVTYSTAFAQESDQVEAHDRPIRLHTILGGAGAAVDEDDQGWRSHFRIGIVESQNDDPDAHTEYTVKRGMFIVGKYDNRHYYSVIPDTWEISVSPNEKSFDASGRVENKEGEIYDVEITGDEISDLQNGTLYYVTGTAVGDDGEVYELFYISALKDRIPAIPPTSSGTQ
jgi:hypothetical protein